MPDPAWLIFAVVAAALVFDFTNGWNDAANAIATVVSTRVLAPLTAVGLSAALNVAGAFYSTKVAKTIGAGIVDPDGVTQGVVLAAMLAGIAWNATMTWLGLPISASHALIGGLVGAAVAHAGWGVVVGSGIRLVLAAMLVSPLLGLLAGWSLDALLRLLFGGASPALVNAWFSRLQVLSAGWMSFAHGTNDAQKVMGVITLALYAGGFIPDIEVPRWVVAAAALAMGLGTLAGGWRVIRTLGMRLTHLRPVDGFSAETGAALVLMAMAGRGIPVSTTHTITGSILGVGAAIRLRAVRWGVAGKIVYAWVLTLPGTALLAALAYQLLALAW